MTLKKSQLSLRFKNIKKTMGLSVTVLFLFLNPLLAAATGTLSACTDGQSCIQNKSTTNDQELKKEFYLIIQSSHKAIIEKNDVDKPGTFKLTLYDVSPYATAFTQRPIRKVELITLGELLDLWKNSDPNGFTKNPPNAAINAFIEDSGSDEHLNFFVQLIEPTYNPKKGTLTYIVKLLEGNPAPIPDSATLKHVNLFIDDICLNCWWPS
ncbi:MAG TPA: hypothetical protein VNK03_04910 [Gammaproteobacteria bacterium]|nr:hypothetical protein [Gammaproteobacteria bacterium]